MMNINSQLDAAAALFRIKFFRSKFPVVVTWSITDKCNYKCIYCQRWQKDHSSLPTKEVFRIIDQLKKLHCARISFSGGEPLLRDDMGDIIVYSKKNGISSTVITNGSLVPEKIEWLVNTDLLEISLDGPREINDLIRGQGSYDKAMQALKAAKNAAIKVVLSTVLTRYNLDCLGFFLDVAENFNVGLTFGPVGYIHSRDSVIDSLAPDKEKLSNFADELVTAKKAGRPVLNSITALEYMKSYPLPEKIPCFAGKAFCHVGAGGELYPCATMQNKQYNSKTGDFMAAFKNLFCDNQCGGCWCMGTLELNRLLDFQLSVIPEFIKLS